MSADNKDKFIAELRELIVEQNELSLKSFTESFYKASNDQVKATDKLRDEFIAHQKRMEPVAKAFENTTWLGRLVIQVLKLLGLVAGGIGLYVLVKNLINGKY